MRRRLLTPILTLLLLASALPGALATQAPDAVGATWEIGDIRPLESGDDTYVALSPDGARIAGVGADDGLCVWAIEDMAGSCAEDVGPIRPESIAWSPDGTAVAFSLDHVQLLAESDIFVYELADGVLTNLTDDGHEGIFASSDEGVLVDGVPAWSPDSRQLAFARSQPSDATFGTVIMRIDRAGGEPAVIHRLPLEMPYGIFMPMHWLPDDSIVYTQVSLDLEDAEDGVWRVGADGGNPRHLLPGGAGSDTPGALVMDVAPEPGLALVYAAFLEGASPIDLPEAPQVWLLDIEAGGATPVPNLPPADGEPPELAGRPQAAAFSPDGSAFVAVYGSVMEGTVIAATDIATGEVSVLARDVPGRVGRALPTWAGERFLLPEASQALLITLVPAGGAVAASPAASVVTGTPSVPAPATPVASASAGGAWRVAEAAELGTDSRYPMLSPDGLMLAGMDGEGMFCVWIVETLAASCADEQLPIREETIAWSPDGTAVAFALNAAVHLYESDIYVYEVQQGRLVNLTDDGHEGGLLDFTDVDPPIDDVPAWSPDSQEIAFVRSFFGGEEPGSTTIMRIARAGGEPVEVLSLDADEPMTVWTPMRWLPDGTLLFSRLSTSADDTRNGVWTVPTDGGDPIQIAPGSEGTDIPGAVIADVDAGRGQAIVVAWLLAGQRGGSDQPIFWLVDIASGERRPFPALTGDGDRPPVVLEAGYAPDGAAILMVTLTEAGLELLTMDPESLAVTPVPGEPIETALLPDASLRWAADGAVVLHASGGSLLLRLEPTGDAGAATPAPATPVASPAASATGWRIADERALDLGGDPRYVAMTPDGQWLAGVGPDGTVCIWDVATLAPDCTEEVLPVRQETLTWAPDGSAVAFALDLRGLQESDIYVLERESGTLTNLTDDGMAGDLLGDELIDANPPLDDVPTWSPDSQRIAFVRSFAGVDGSSTRIMWIDRAGGEPVEVLPLGVDEAMAVFMPMHWLPDGTLVYSQVARDLADPHNGVWTIGVDDGASPLQLVPGSEESDVPGPWVSDTDDGRAIVYSYWLMSQFAFGEGPLFWMVDIATGELASLQVPSGIAPGPVRIVDAAFAPDGATAVLSTMSPGGARLMTLDIASGEVSALDTEPRGKPLSAGAPQWATNDTVVIQTPDGPVLLTLEPAA